MAALWRAPSGVGRLFRHGLWMTLAVLSAGCRPAVSIPGPDPTQPAWLPPPLKVVATTQEEAQQMSEGLRQAGFRTEMYSLEGAQAGEGWWWLSRDVVQSLGLQGVQTYLGQGAGLMLDGQGLVAQGLLNLQNTDESVRQVQMFGATVKWDTPVAGYKPSSTSKAYAESGQGNPVLLSNQKLLWSLAPLDQGAGLLRLPYLPQVLYERGLRPLAERHEIDLYFDPDAEANVPLPALVERWRKAGVRRVFVSAWKFDRLKGWSYDYSKLIEEAHRQGVLVYAWVALPHVSFSFWQQHPECKEITASGLEARIFWRENVALGVPGCLEATWAEVKNLLESHPFDGVNLAELYFESPAAGPESPATYTPFHPQVRQQFKTQAGFDPADLFKPTSPHYWPKNAGGLSRWESFRVGLLTNLHREFLTRLSKLAVGKHLLVTLIDDRYPGPLTARLSRNIGVSTSQIIGLRQTIPFEVQIEDPYILWSESPQRYRTIAGRYAEVPTQALSLDINVVERGDVQPGRSTTSLMQGLELYQSIANVGAEGAALALYSSATLTAADYGWIKYALAAESTSVSEAGGVIQTRSPKAFLLHLNRPFARVFLDGKPWGGRTEQGVWVPAGEHRLWLEAGAPQPATLSDTTCPDFELTGNDPSKQNFSAKTTVPCAVLINGSWSLINP